MSRVFADGARRESRKSIEEIDPNIKHLNLLADTDGLLPSPVDLNITKTEEITLPELVWHHLDSVPKKMKITNTGYTMILSAKWYQERPYLNSGPLIGNYVFSQMHLHWGKNDGEGSEHTADGVQYPVEMHVVTFRSCYLTQESALKEKDGVAVLVYLFKLQSGVNAAFQLLLEHIENIQKPHSSFKLKPFPLTEIIKPFKRDYFFYWGSVTTTICIHSIMWLISREPVGVSADQVEDLRCLVDANDELLMGNFRSVEPKGDRNLYHVNPSTHKLSTMLPLP